MPLFQVSLICIISELRLRDTVLDVKVFTLITCKLTLAGTFSAILVSKPYFIRALVFITELPVPRTIVRPGLRCHLRSKPTQE